MKTPSKPFKSVAQPLATLLFLLAPFSGQCFYNPSAGRWLNRDPIEERGGILLYGFATNQPVSAYDTRGLCGGCKCLRPHVTYDPGNDTMEGFKWYDDPKYPGNPRFGNQIQVFWEVAGDSNKCHYYQDETHSTLDVTRPDGTTKHIQGTNSPSIQYNIDDMGIVPSSGDGYYLLEVNWDVTFRCIGSDPSTPPVERHDGLWKVLARTYWPP